MFSFRSINSTNRSTPQQLEQEALQQQQQSYNNTLIFQLYRPTNQMYIQQKPQPQPQEPPKELKQSKMKWGQPTWNLFHTMAEKIMTENFFRLKPELIDIIKSICYNLPCPDCASHATTYINQISFNNITTKEQLKEMFYIFHNEVNARKNFPLYDKGALNERYSSMNIQYCIEEFLIHFRDKHKSLRMLADDLHRSRLSNKIELWFKGHIGDFLQ